MPLPLEITEDDCYSVKELAEQIKKRVESGFKFIRVRGEVSNLTIHKSGHIYFALKEEDAVIDAVSWRGHAQKFDVALEDGLEIIGRGSITTYIGRSKYQLVMDSFEPAGKGALFALLEKRRKTLEAEGVFSPLIKKPLPKFPKIIGLITSDTGAVLHDISTRLQSRFVNQVLLWPVNVQGKSTPQEVINAVRGFNQLEEHCKPDVIIIARGGGSFEDLWPFNDEELAREVSRSDIPIISAIGHEPDTPLMDFAADVRAPTPTAAAEMVAYKLDDLDGYVSQTLSKVKELAYGTFKEYAAQYRLCANFLRKPDSIFDGIQHRLDRVDLNSLLSQFVQQKNLRFVHVISKLSPPTSKLDNISYKLQKIHISLENTRSLLLKDTSSRLDNLVSRLHQSSVAQTLKRGFAIVSSENGIVLTSQSDYQVDQIVSIHLQDGKVTAKIISLE